MRGRSLLVALLTGIFASLAIGCSDDSTKPAAPLYGDLTDRDHIVQNIETSYAERNLSRYAELQHDAFIWYGVKWCAAIGNDGSYDRSRDLYVTEQLYINALALDLLFGPGVWSAVNSLGGEPCDDCWETERSYFLTWQFTVGGPENSAEGSLRIIVTPVDDAADGGRKEYRLRNALATED